MSTTVTTSQRFTINWRDIVKGFLTAFITTFITSIYTWINAGSFPTGEQFKTAGLVGLGAGLAYIIKNFLSPAEIVVTNPTKETVEAVKEGEARVTVTKA